MWRVQIQWLEMSLVASKSSWAAAICQDAEFYPQATLYKEQWICLESDRSSFLIWDWGGGGGVWGEGIWLRHNKIYLIPPIMFNHGKGGGGKGIWFRHNRIYLIPPYSSVIFLYTIFIVPPFLLLCQWRLIPPCLLWKACDPTKILHLSPSPPPPTIKNDCSLIHSKFQEV